MKRSTRRAVAVLGASMALLAVPGSAQAQNGPLAPVGALIGTYEERGERQITTLNRTVTGFQFYVVEYDPYAGNGQAITGFLGTALLAGQLTAAHTFDKSQDNPSWVLSGTVDPSGAAPPLPVGATFTLQYDRIRAVHTIVIDGNIAGQPIHGETGPIVQPIYGVPGF